mgnify:CR=1 FL=1
MSGRKKNSKPDLVVWDEEKGYYQKELTYGSNVGAPAIKMEDVGGWKQTQANISPFAPYGGKDPWDYVKDVEQIKYKVTPDEIIMGIDYEMKKLVLKDKQVAKILYVKGRMINILIKQ